MGCGGLKEFYQWNRKENLGAFQKSSERPGMKATAILPTPSLQAPKPPATSTIQNTDSACTIPVWWNNVKPPVTLKVKGCFYPEWITSNSWTLTICKKQRFQNQFSDQVAHLTWLFVWAYAAYTHICGYPHDDMYTMRFFQFGFMQMCAKPATHIRIWKKRMPASVGRPCTGCFF